MPATPSMHHPRTQRTTAHGLSILLSFLLHPGPREAQNVGLCPHSATPFKLETWTAQPQQGIVFIVILPLSSSTYNPKSTSHPPPLPSLLPKKKLESLTLEWQQSFPASLSHLYGDSRMQGNNTYILIISYSSSYATFLYSIGNRFHSSTTHINAFTLLSLPCKPKALCSSNSGLKPTSICAAPKKSQLVMPG